MCCTNILGCVIVIAGIGAAVICVVGMAVPVWNTVKSDAVSTTVSVKSTTWEGLWQTCTFLELDQDGFDCDTLDEANTDTSSKKAALAMILIGVVLIIACVIVVILHLTLCGLIEFLTKIAAALAFAAALFILIGVIVYGVKIHDDLGGDLSAGFGLCISSAVICIVIGILCFIVD